MANYDDRISLTKREWEALSRVVETHAIEIQRLGVDAAILRVRIAMWGFGFGLVGAGLVQILVHLFVK